MTTLNLLKDKSEILKRLTSLGWECIHPSEKFEPDSREGSRDHILNRHCTPDVPETFFTLFGKNYQTFEDVKHLLEKEPNAEHLSIKEIDDSLIDYCRDIININSKERIKNTKEVKAIAEDFVSELLLPEQEWLMVSPINGLSLESEQISISDHVIKKFSFGDITKYTHKLDQVDRKILNRYFRGKVCVLVSVMATDSKQAIEKGDRKINHILHIIRGYFGSRIFCMLTTPSEFIAVNKETGKKRTLIRNTTREQCYVDLENEEKFLMQISDLSVLLNGRMPEKITNDILRALRWLGSAVQDKELEDKLVKCIFALETLFVPEKGERDKGETLAFRVALLELRVRDYYNNPDSLHYLYGIRSLAVHGADIKKGSITMNDIHYLESRTWQAILCACGPVLNSRIQELSNVNELIDWIEEEDDRMQDVKKFISEFCNQELMNYVSSMGNQNDRHRE